MKKIFFTLIFLSAVNIFAQYNGNKFGLSINYNYTSSSELFTYPNSPDEVLRTLSVPLESVYSPSIDFRYLVMEDLIIGINFEQMKKRLGVRNVTVGTRIGVVNTRVQDEYTIYPLELNAYYFIPFSTERFKFSFGGGIGFYFGNHKIYFDDFPGLELTNESEKVSFGIQVSTGMDYMVTDYFSVRGEMRFRDPELEMKNPDENRRIQYNDQIVTVPQEILESKINVDGVTFTVGIVFHF